MPEQHEYRLTPQQISSAQLYWMDLYRPWFVLTAVWTYQCCSTSYHSLDLSGSPRYPQ